MRGVLLEVPESLLEERRRTGADRFDEMWDGVLHMPPPPNGPHQDLAGELYTVFKPLARARGLMSFFETGLFRRKNDYKVPDQSYVRPESFSTRGVEAAELVVEIKSPGDETYDKLGWYHDLGVREVLVVHPTDRRVELFRDGAAVEPVDGAVTLEALGVRLETVDGPRLRLTWDGGTADV